MSDHTYYHRFIINPFYINQDTQTKVEEIQLAIDLALGLIQKLSDENELSQNSQAKLIGVGNEAKGKVYSLIGSKFCLKVANLGKHVGKDQTGQFDLQNKCIDAIKGKSIEIEDENYALKCIPSVAVYTDDSRAYTLMIRHDNTLRLWDEENIPFKDKDNWEVIRAIKRIFREIDGEKFEDEMDVNGNNILVDYENKILFLIDPYVPEKSMVSSS